MQKCTGSTASRSTWYGVVIISVLYEAERREIILSSIIIIMKLIGCTL